jgi:gamma-butyrobetaine dioxygenase
VATESDYAAKLSSASLHTLRLQGGPMSRQQVGEFEALPYAPDAVALRRLDEAAKDASKKVPGFHMYRDQLARMLASGCSGGEVVMSELRAAQ